MMFAMGRFDVPIAVGRYTGEDAMKQLPAAAGFELSDFVAAGGVVYYGEDYLAGLMGAATPTDPLFVVEIAPATSLGDIIRTTPRLAANVITTAMSGSVFRGYDNSSTPAAEYNVRMDIPGSQAMYAASWLSPLMMAPLDTSGLLHCIAPEWSSLLSANTSAHPYAKELLRNYAVWCNCTPTDAGKSDTLYDAQAAYQVGFYAREWAGGGMSPPPIPSLTQQRLHISVNATGYTVIDPNAQPVFAAIAFPDGLTDDTHKICGSIIGSIIAAA